MEAKILMAVNMTNFTTCFLSRRMGSDQGLVDHKRWMNALETRRHDRDQVQISHGERIKESDETLGTAIHRQLKFKNVRSSYLAHLQRCISIELSGGGNVPAHFWAVASPLFNFLVVEECFLVSILVILLCRQLLPSERFEAQGEQPAIDVVRQPSWAHCNVSMVIGDRTSDNEAKDDTNGEETGVPL
jgi:hypothetical protein